MALVDNGLYCSWQQESLVATLSLKGTFLVSKLTAVSCTCTPHSSDGNKTIIEDDDNSDGGSNSDLEF